MLTEVLHGRQHIRPRRQQTAVAQRTEDPRVVGGGRAQVEQLPLGAGDALVQQLTQPVGVAVQLLGGQRAGRGTARGARVRTGRGRTGAGDGLGLGLREAEEVGEPLLGADGLGGPALGLVGALGGLGGVLGAGGGQFGGGVPGGGRTGPVGGLPGGFARRVPCLDGRLLGVRGGERGTGRVGVGGAVVQPAGPDGLGGLLGDLGEPLLEVLGLTAGALGVRGGRGGVAVRRLTGLLEGGGAFLLLVGDPLTGLGRRVQATASASSIWRGVRTATRPSPTSSTCLPGARRW
ncbi:hypothetical protein ACWCPV_31760, partial [Streptomyces tubercidicus]